MGDRSVCCTKWGVMWVTLCVTEFEVHTDGVAWVIGCLVTAFG